jgi:hypothetical protein
LHLRHVDALDAAIAEIDAKVDRDLDPFRHAVRQLRTIPGVSDLTAQVIVSEIGTAMSRFPTAGHFNRALPGEHTKRLVRQIAKPGFTCVLMPAAGGQVSVSGQVSV